jgi:hypothetical protein
MWTKQSKLIRMTRFVVQVLTIRKMDAARIAPASVKSASSPLSQLKHRLSCQLKLYITQVHATERRARHHPSYTDHTVSHCHDQISTPQIPAHQAVMLLPIHFPVLHLPHLTHLPRHNRNIRQDILRPTHLIVIPTRLPQTGVRGMKSHTLLQFLHQTPAITQV